MKKNGAIRSSGKRSKLEEKFSAVLTEVGATEHYEVDKVAYVVPESKHKYIIDFSLENGIAVECKGYLRDYDERHKYELIKQQHPELDLRFVFDNSQKLITRTKMTHATWAEKYGFPWCDIRDTDTIKSWINEKKKK